VVVAGMHRSGTSMVARSLARAGLAMGDEFHPTDGYNPLGYYEDRAFMALGRRMACAACDPSEPGHHDWGVTISERLDRRRLDRFRERAAELVAERRARGRPWGFKDPRSTLFLGFWGESVPEARFVLVYRPPWDVIASAMRLREGPFARRPQIAAAAWRLYNRELLRFARARSERCVVLPSAAFAERPGDAAAALRRAFGDAVPAFSPHALGSGVSRTLLSITPPGDPQARSIRERWPDLDQTLAELDALSALRDPAGDQPPVCSVHALPSQ
jgi:hypothetical protein